MSRRALPACVLALALILPATAAAPVPPPAPRPAEPADPLLGLLAHLNARIDEPIQPNGSSPVGYLDRLSRAYGLNLVVDEESFKAANILPAEVVLDFKVPRGIRLQALLFRVCEAIFAADGVRGVRALYVTQDRIEVTTPERLQAAADIPRDDTFGPWRRRITPMLSAAATNRPLAAALAEVAELHDVSIVVAAGAAQAAATPISYRLLNAPLDTGIATLARQAGLDVVLTDNVFLVTRPDHARALRQAEWERATRAAVKEPGFEGLHQKWVSRLSPGLDPVGPDGRVRVQVHGVKLGDVVWGFTEQGFTVTVDPGVGTKADAEVTASLENVTAEAAVKVLAEMAGLRAVRLDGVLFVTTVEKAARLTPPVKRKKDRKKDR